MIACGYGVVVTMVTKLIADLTERNRYEVLRLVESLRYQTGGLRKVHSKEDGRPVNGSAGGDRAPPLRCPWRVAGLHVDGAASGPIARKPGYRDIIS
jgi:hypothetical protein